MQDEEITRHKKTPYKVWGIKYYIWDNNCGANISLYQGPP